MVGCLALVGRGQWRPEDMRKALEARDRAALGFNAPPHGLYFVEAIYPLRRYSARSASNSCAARYFSASSAAMQPVPAAVTAWR